MDLLGVALDAMMGRKTSLARLGRRGHAPIFCDCEGQRHGCCCACAAVERTGARRTPTTARQPPREMWMEDRSENDFF